MKKSLLLALLMFFTMHCYSNGYTYVKMELKSVFNSIPNRNIDEDEIYRHRAPMVMPSVSYDESGIYIQCISTLYDVEVIINDEKGNCLLSTITDIWNETFIELPETANLMKYSIELIYGDIHLYGEF